MKAGDGDHMGQPRPPEGTVDPIRQLGFVSGNKGSNQGRGAVRKGPGNAVFQGSAHHGGPVFHRYPLRPLHGPLLTAAYEKDPLGVIVVGLLPRHGVRHTEGGRYRQPVAGTEVVRPFSAEIK